MLPPKGLYPEERREYLRGMVWVAIVIAMIFLVLFALANRDKKTVLAPTPVGPIVATTALPPPTPSAKPLVKVGLTPEQEFIQEVDSQAELRDAGAIVPGLIKKFGMNPTIEQLTALLAEIKEKGVISEKAIEEMVEAEGKNLKDNRVVTGEQVKFARHFAAKRNNEYRVRVAFYNTIAEKEGKEKLNLMKEFLLEVYLRDL